MASCNPFTTTTTIMIFSLACSILLIVGVASHGRLRDPPSRSSIWRDNSSYPHNYEDNELFCGGFTRQWDKNNGKCGICGDAWDVPAPRPNELGGTYGIGTITRKYKKGQTIPTWIELTQNHLGWYELRLCPIKDSKTDATQECLDKHILQKADGTGTKVEVPSGQKNFTVEMKLPADLTCDHCVVQWDYVTGNRWDWCKDGEGALGCGPQETFRGCADVSISP